MDSDTDSLFGEFLPSERALNRFRPKVRPKNVKPSLPPSNLPDSTRLVPSTLEPSSNAPDLKCHGEKSNLSNFTTEGSFTTASTLDAIQESLNQPNGSHSEPSVPDSGIAVALHCDHGESSEVAATSISMESLNFAQPPSSNEEEHEKFHPKLSPQISAPSTSADATQPMSPTLEPFQAFNMMCSEKGPILPTISIAGLSTIGTCTSRLQDELDSSNQLEASHSEDLVFDDNEKDASKPDQEQSYEDAGTFSNMESLRDDSDPALATSDANVLGGSNISSNDIEAPKPKRAPRKSKRQMTGDEKPVRKRKKTSEVPSSAEEETAKKKFPHGTQRRRRQVNKVLLETPEEEIDRNQLSLKDLIMLGEFKDRTSNKEARTSNNSSPNRRGSLSKNPLGDEQYDGDEENRDTERSSPKFNYHYLMARSSGRWSKSETERFYQALRQFGENFAMIEKLFPGRTRHQIRNKYKKEYLQHKEQLNDASSHRSKDHSLFKLVIQKLREEAEQNTYKEEVTN